MKRVVQLCALLLCAFAVSYALFSYAPRSSVDSQPLTRSASEGSQPLTRSASEGTPTLSPAGMVWIPGGTFWRGSDNPKMHDAQPIHQVTVGGFWMDETAVTNEQFARFVEATRYVTVAERTPQARDFP